MKKITFFLLFGLIAFFVNAQVALTENFDGGLALPAGWTGTGYFGDVAQPCSGFSQRDNLSSTSTTGNLTSPNQIGVSNGTDVDISFDYKVVDWSAAVDGTAPGWGEILVNYSTNNGATWTAAGVINDGNHVTSGSCAPMSFTVPAASVPAGSDFKLQFVGNWTAGNFYIYFDNVVAIQEVSGAPTCSNMTTPANNSTGVSINTNLVWSAASNVPTGYNLTVGTTPGGTDIVPLTDNGLSTNFNLPTLDYSTTYYVNITPYNSNGSAVDCPEFTFTTGADPNAPVDCESGVPVNINYCYTNSDTTTWNFQSSTGAPLNVFFNSGFLESGFDTISVYDGSDSSGTLLYSDDGALTGVSLVANSGFLFIAISSDTSVSCSSGSACCSAPIDFDVSCVDETAVPNCNSDLTTPANGATDVIETTDISWSAASVLVTGYTISVGTTSGGTDIANNVDVGNVLTYDPGVLPYETTIYVTIVPYNDNGPAINCNEQSFTIKADPNQVVDCGSGEVINTTHCYNSNENQSVNAFYFASSDGSPLVLIFNSGEVENGWDELYVIDSDGTNLNAATPYGNAGNLAGLIFTSTGSTLTVYVESDSSVSCVSSTAIDPWDFDVTCVDTSALPNCDADLASPINGATDVNENADISWTAATVFVTGYYISIGTTDGGTDIADNVDVGNVLTYEPGTLPYDTTIYVTITPYNDNGNAEGCTSQSFTVKADPNQVVDCGAGEVINTSYCYGNSENESVNAFYFASSDGSPLFIIFNAGQVENGWDELYIIDSDGTNLNAATPYGNAGNLTGLSYTSTGSTLTVYVESDGIIGCQSSGYTPWDFDVTCVDTSALPNCDADLASPFNGETDVDEDTTISWTQATVFVTGYYISIGTTPGGTDVADSVDVGNVLTYNPGTLNYATTYYVTIVPYNDNGNAEDCTEQSFTVRNDPNVIVDCEAAQVVNTTFCYENGSNFFLELFSFQSSNGFPLNIEFNAGYIESCCDFIRIEDGNGTILYEGNNGGNLAGLAIQSITDSFVLYLDADTSVSCSSTGNAPWDFDVWCQTCIPQTVDFDVVNGDCTSDPNNPTFEVAVNITDMGDASSITVTDNQGSDAQVITETGTLIFGPYAANTVVSMTAANTDDGNCVVESNPLTFLCPPPPNPCSIVYAGEDVSVECDNPETTLSGNFHLYGQDTNNYEINSIDTCPTPPVEGATPTSVDSDDVWSSVIDLGFDFCFFGGVYNQVVIGSNGVISFEIGNANTGNGWDLGATGAPDTLPNATNPTIYEANIFGVGHDIDPSVCGSIDYVVLGSSPYRQFVVNFNSVCHFGSSCNQLQSTSQIVLHESSNNIDVHVLSKPTCTAWNDGYAVIGIQNIDDTIGIAAPGRNTGVWTVTQPESWRFSPSGTPNYTLEWLDENGDVVGNEDTVTVTPTETTTYTFAVTYDLCTGGQATVEDHVVVEVSGGSGDASFTLTPTCDGATAEITGDTGGTFTFNPEPGDGATIDEQTGTITGGTSGATYTVEYTSDGNCPASSTEEVTVLPADDASFTVTPTCDGATVEISGDMGGTFALNPEPGDGAAIDSATGTVTGATNGSTYTIEYTTAGECQATSSQEFTVNDSEAPSAVCNNITVMLDGNGSYTLSGDDITAIGAGSSDNCSLASMSVSQDSFTCDNLGNNTITLTVTDAAGNSSTCEAVVTVEGELPSISFTEEGLSEFCPGIILTAISEGAVSYSWTTTEDTQSIEVTENGTYGVTVTNAVGCSAYAEYVVDSIEDGAALSDYTIIAERSVFLHGNNLVISGGVGVSGNNGEIKLRQDSHIQGFGQAMNFDLNQDSTIGVEMNEAADITLPSFIYNTVSNNSSPSVTIPAGQTMVLDGDNYNLVDVRQGATVVFTQSNIYINKIKTAEVVSIEFESCANVYLNDMFILSKYSSLNPFGMRVSFFVDNNVHIDKGCKVDALIYVNGNNRQILAKGSAIGSNDPQETFMKGLFIANRVHGDQNVIWQAGDLCDPCPVSDAPQNRNFEVVSWPNPSNTKFNLKLRTDDFFTGATVNVFDLSGKLVHTASMKPGEEVNFGSELEGGIYIVKVTQGGNTKVVRLIKH